CAPGSSDSAAAPRAGAPCRMLPAPRHPEAPAATRRPAPGTPRARGGTEIATPSVRERAGEPPPMATLDGLRVAALTTDGFEEAVLTEPVRALQAAGAQVEIVAPHAGE